MQSRIEQQVMASVAAVHTARRFTSRIALELYALTAAGIALWQLTWVHRVVGNFLNVERGGLGGIWQYVNYAFLHTHLATQLALIVALAAGIAFVVDAARTLMRPTHRFA